MHALAFWFVAASAAVPEAAWQSQGEHDGIALWQRPGPGALVEFRARAMLFVPLIQAAAVVWDVSRHHEWSANCEQSMLLERRPDNSAVAYIRIASPFPLQARDIVEALTARVDGEVLELAFRGTTDVRKPPTADAVRMPLLQGSYRMRHAAAGQTEVTYQVLTDPAGNLPAWAVNWGGREVPVQTLRALLRQAQTQDYRGTAQQLRARLPQMMWDPPAPTADAP